MTHAHDERGTSPAQSILRPVSGSYSGRYQNARVSRPQSTIDNAQTPGIEHKSPNTQQLTTLTAKQ